MLKQAKMFGTGQDWFASLVFRCGELPPPTDARRLGTGGSHWVNSHTDLVARP